MNKTFASNIASDSNQLSNYRSLPIPSYYLVSHRLHMTACACLSIYLSSLINHHRFSTNLNFCSHQCYFNDSITLPSSSMSCATLPGFGNHTSFMSTTNPIPASREMLGICSVLIMSVSSSCPLPQHISHSSLRIAVTQRRYDISVSSIYPYLRYDIYLIARRQMSLRQNRH